MGTFNEGLASSSKSKLKVISCDTSSMISNTDTEIASDHAFTSSNMNFTNAVEKNNPINEEQRISDKVNDDKFINLYGKVMIDKILF